MKHGKLLQKIYWTSAFLAVFIIVLLGSVVFLNPSSVGNARFFWNINLWAVLWALNFLIILALAFVLARTLIKLFFEYQANRPGSRIKSKLVITLIICSLFPALMMSFLAFGLINENLRQWASSPSETLLSSAQLIASSYYDEKRVATMAQARLLAREVKAEDLSRSRQFATRLEGYGFQGILLVDAEGRTVFREGSWPRALKFDSTLWEVLSGADHYFLHREVRVDHGLVGIPVLDSAGVVRGALFANFVIPESITFHALEASEAFDKYEQIKSGVSRFETNYFLILALTTLTLVFGFVWLGTYIAKRITVPLEALAEGSRELAEGNLDYRVGVQAVDELGILVDSFNRMAQEIKDSRLSLEKANQELRGGNVRLEERRRYIETILQNIATGVITIDESETIQTVNKAALHMLQASRDQILNQSIREVAEGELYDEFRKMKKRARLYGTCRKDLTLRRGERLLHVAATITAKPDSSGDEGQYLMVLDDLTELIKTEKFAAWQEVARRLAHEIKNPLTPIQLSAERIKARFEKLNTLLFPQEQVAEFERVLADAVRMIVAEAETLKALVEEFSRFARMPIFKPTKVELHDLLGQTLALYDGGLGQIQVSKAFDPRVGQVRIDVEQMRRVFINLIDNSLDALAESQAEKKITIRTQLNERRESVTIEFQDSGAGIAPEDYENLFLPYFSTKRKGTGLGLAIVRQVISEHNGFVRAEPNLPQGTRLIMELPIH